MNGEKITTENCEGADKAISKLEALSPEAMRDVLEDWTELEKEASEIIWRLTVINRKLRSINGSLNDCYIYLDEDDNSSETQDKQYALDRATYECRTRLKRIAEIDQSMVDLTRPLSIMES